MMMFVWIFLAFLAGGICGMTALAIVVMGKQDKAIEEGK